MNVILNDLSKRSTNMNSIHAGSMIMCTNDMIIPYISRDEEIVSMQVAALGFY